MSVVSGFKYFQREDLVPVLVKSENFGKSRNREAEIRKSG